MTVLAVVTAVVVVAQAEVLALVLSGGWSPGWLVAVVVVRGFVVWGGQVVTQRFAAAVKASLRKRVLRDSAGSGGQAGSVATLVVKGVDAVEPYFAGYLPQVVVAAVVPVAVVVRLSFADLASAVVVLVTLPLVPVFAALVGMHTRDRTRAQWAGMAVVGGHFLDVVRGLGTLKVFGRAAAQAGTVRAMAGAHAAATMRTLRVAFLSALVLELVATLSVALVAVPVGLRLLHGGVTLQVALLVLLLAPEAYLPLRAAGARFHASAEGLAVLEAVAARRAVAGTVDGQAPPERSAAQTSPAAGLAAQAHPLDGLAAQAPPPECLAAQASPPGGSPDSILPGKDDIKVSAGAGCGQLGEVGAGCGQPGRRVVVRVGRVRAPDLRCAEVVVERVVVRYPGREVLGEVSLRVGVGERVGLVGASGAGKSTLLAVLLGFVTPASGRVLVGGVDLREIDRESWLRQVAWVPQRPTLFPGTVGENIALGSSGDVRGAAAEMGLAHLVDAAHPLSSGERQRVALARALVRDDARLLLLDEPTSRLDGGTEEAVLRATRRLVAGRTAVVVAHRPVVLGEVDRVVEFSEAGAGR
ncbi:ABC transporter ATP-binding protein/permease [Saccharothrix carnea]|uniref:ABC transporter ATP-binding protein/permease n=1 Tax=Saccharothrix carnea TaxID=1280637 RepID=UPI001C626B7A|nr:ATP-binding cassette domain-containing protein [Saccharothrix carnea]